MNNKFADCIKDMSDNDKIMILYSIIGAFGAMEENNSLPDYLKERFFDVCEQQKRISSN